MASSWQTMIFIIVILAITLPISSGNKRRWRRSRDSNAEQNLRDICSKTHKKGDCWRVLKPELRRFDNSDDRDIVNGVLELAMAKSKEIRDKLDHWFSDSDNEKLKQKYHSCSNNYNEADRNLEEAHRNIDSDDYQHISDQIDDAEQELKKCKRKFEGGSFDPPHVGDRNKEFGLYLDIVRTANDRLQDYDRDEEHNLKL